jgi:hypothetical protein
MDDVVAVLAREQLALERLLFRLHHTRGILARDDERFLGMAADELEAAAHTVRELEAARAAVVAGSGGTLRTMAEDAPEPYGSMLADHRAALGRLAGEIGALLESTQDLATDRLAELEGTVGAGRFRRGRRRRRAVDELDRAMAAAGYESVLAASSSLRLPSLVSFLS